MNKNILIPTPLGKVISLFIALAVVMVIFTGCATHSRTHRETATVTNSSTAGTASATPADGTTTTVHEESTTTEEHPRGIIGGTVHVIGQILAFPFKVIGGVIEAIF